MKDSRFLFQELNFSFPHFGHVCKFHLHFNLQWFAKVQTKTLAVVSIQVKSATTSGHLHGHTVRQLPKASIILHSSKYPEQALLLNPPRNVMKRPSLISRTSQPSVVLLIYSNIPKSIFQNQGETTPKETLDFSPLEPSLGTFFFQERHQHQQMGREISTVIYFDVTLSKAVPPWVLGSHSILGKVTSMRVSVGSPT